MSFVPLSTNKAIDYIANAMALRIDFDELVYPAPDEDSDGSEFYYVDLAQGERRIVFSPETIAHAAYDLAQNSLHLTMSCGDTVILESLGKAHHPLTSDDLDDLVYDLACAAASSVNNAGATDQSLVLGADPIEGAVTEDQQESLDESVISHAEELASSVNNSGVDGQIAFILGAVSRS